MKVRYLAALAVVSLLGFGAIAGLTRARTAQSLPNTGVEVAVNPCAGKANPCAGKPASTSQAVAKHPQVYTEKGVALDGQDVVAYFTQGKPVQGNQRFTHRWNGATWQFSSAQHRDLFAQNPEKYAPQYGGYCAKAASDGNLATTVATAWEVRGGKLYLNYDASAQAEWQQDTANKIKKANANWPKILANDTLYR
jgi:YHS domain-containing protein